MAEHLIETVEELRSSYGEPSERAVRKPLDRLDRHCRRFIGLSPFVVLASSGADGHVYCSRRGDPAGFVAVLDDHRVLLPDRRGNNRTDSLTNVEIACAIQEIENVFGTGELPGDAGLPGMGAQIVPERLLSFGMVGQTRRRAADTNVRGTVELDRRARRGRNLQQDQSSLVVSYRFEGEHHAGPQPLGQPEFERLTPALRGTGFEPCSGDGVIAVPHSPHDVAEVSIFDPRRIGQGGDQLSDHVRIGIAP